MTAEVRPDAVVRVAPVGSQAEAWSLVLTAMDIPHRVEYVPEGYALVVPTPYLVRALRALDAQDAEASEPPVPKAPDLGRSYVGVAMAVAFLAMLYVTGPRDGVDTGGWFRAGSGLADKIMRGHWWRTITALTLHADVMHAVGNGVASVIFVGAVGRWLGGGLAVLGTLLAGALGNAVTALVYRHGHDVVGASTATFGALGILVGLQLAWRIQNRSSGRLGRSFLALAAGLALLAMLGSGDFSDWIAQAFGKGATKMQPAPVSRVDVLAHAAGFVSGTLLGSAWGTLRRRAVSWKGQGVALVAACSALAGAWLLARGRL